MPKKLILSLLVVVGIILVTSGSVAYFMWSSSDTGVESDINVTVTSGNGSCTIKNDNTKKLIPVKSKEEGRVITIEASQEIADAAVISWDLLINKLNTNDAEGGLKDASFKYELVNTTTKQSYGSGTFENAQKGTKITLSNNSEKINSNAPNTFTLYLWIDGNSDNSVDMANQEYNFDISCNITGTDVSESE